MLWGNDTAAAVMDRVGNEEIFLTNATAPTELSMAVQGYAMAACCDRFQGNARIISGDRKSAKEWRIESLQAT